MAQLWCTGPALLYVGLGSVSNPTPVFVGTDNDTPTIDIIPRFREVRNDIGGEDPLDDSYQGRSAAVRYKINRMDEVAIAALEQTNPFSATQRGADDPGDVGSLMVTEGKAFPVWVVFPYAANSPIPAIAKAAMLGMPAGYHFVAGHLTRDTHSRLGTKEKDFDLEIVCRRIYKPFSQRSQGGSVGAGASQFQGNTGQILSAPVSAALGSFTLYNHDMTGVPLPT